MKRILLVLVLVVAGMFYAPPSRAHAIGNSITVSPAQVDLELSTSDSAKQTTFTINNSYNVPVVLSIELMGIDEQSGRIIPSPDIDQNLLPATHLAQTILTIPEQSSATVSLTITNSVSLSPGGHYGTIVFTQQKVGDKELNFTQAISAGLFVVKRGGQLREVDATSFATRALPFQIPSSAQISIKNVGNVHVIPRAAVLVYTKNGTLVAKSVANLESRRILPSKQFDEKVIVTQVKRLWWPQKLKVVFEYRADSIEEAKYGEKSIMYVPAYTAPLLLLLVCILWLVARRKVRNRRKRTEPAKVNSFGDDALIEETASSAETINAVQKTIPRKSKKRSKKPKKIVVEELET